MARVANRRAFRKIVYRYVVHSQVKAYEEKGWVVVSRFERAPHHAQYSVIMERTWPIWFQYLPRFVRLLCLRLYNEPSQY